ncbi:MAG: hypothetical protein OXC31_03315, partial [Spirochaetaceae bacterium]|nr:hypothetical protein [Spirochaetaceae bacterium]
MQESGGEKDRRANLGTALERLATGRFVITAEQAQAGQARAYRGMVDKGLVDAVTLPDLPLVGRFRDLLARRRPAARGPREPLERRIAGALEKSADPVFTVSASLRTAGMVARRGAAARVGGAVALLGLSGGGLGRRLVGVVQLHLAVA